MYMRRKSVVRAKNTRKKNVFVQVKPICYARCSYNNVVLRTLRTFIFESVRHLHVFNDNVAVPDVLETIFFQFKLIGWKLKITHLHFNASL